MVIFGPGYLASNAVAEDLGIAKWWMEPEGVTRAKERGMLYMQALNPGRFRGE